MNDDYKGNGGPTLYNRLLKIMEGCDFIAKDKRNDFHGYDYASEYAIKVKLHELLVKHGVLFHLSVNSISQDGDKTLIKLAYSFIEAETGESLDGNFVGLGQDNADKGVYKAITGALKYILTSNFVIPTGDDPEGSNPKPSAPPQHQHNHQTGPAADVPFESTPPPANAPIESGPGTKKDVMDRDTGELECSQCGDFITEKVYKYSMDKYGKALCYDDQKGAN